MLEDQVVVAADEQAAIIEERQDATIGDDARVAEDDNGAGSRGTSATSALSVVIRGLDPRTYGMLPISLGPRVKPGDDGDGGARLVRGAPTARQTQNRNADTTSNVRPDESGTLE